MLSARLLLFAALLAPMCLKAGERSLLDQGYGQMYNLPFQAAHRPFQESEKSLRNQDCERAAAILRDLAREFPHNRPYA